MAIITLCISVIALLIAGGTFLVNLLSFIADFLQKK